MKRNYRRPSGIFFSTLLENIDSSGLLKWSRASCGDKEHPPHTHTPTPTPNLCGSDVYLWGDFFPTGIGPNTEVDKVQNVLLNS